MAIYRWLQIKLAGSALTGKGRSPVFQAYSSTAIRAVISSRKLQQTALKNSIRNNFTRLLNEHISELLEFFLFNSEMKHLAHFSLDNFFSYF